MNILLRFDADVKLLDDQIAELQKRKDAIINLQNQLRLNPDVAAAMDRVHQAHSGPTPMEAAVNKIIQ